MVLNKHLAHTCAHAHPDAHPTPPGFFLKQIEYMLLVFFLARHVCTIDVKVSCGHEFSPAQLICQGRREHISSLRKIGPRRTKAPGSRAKWIAKSVYWRNERDRQEDRLCCGYDSL